MAEPYLPPDAHVTYQQQYTRCNRPGCRKCSAGTQGHGPYWYAYWHMDGRLRSRYLGKQIPPTVQSPIGDLTPRAQAKGQTTPRQRRQPGQSKSGANSTGAIGRIPTLRVQTLGAFVVSQGDKQLADTIWGQRKAAALFKILLSMHGYQLHREQAAELLWPDAEPTRADNSLRFTLHQLRTILGIDNMYIQSRGSQLVLVPAPGKGSDEKDQYPADWLDAAAFVEAAAAAQQREDLQACRTALALYTGSYLPDDRYEDWTALRREELAQQRIALLVHCARICAKQGTLEDHIASWQAVLDADSCHEEAAYATMRLLAKNGQISDALRVYNALAAALHEELGIKPAAAIERLHAQLRTSERSLTDASSATLNDTPTALLTNQPIPLTRVTNLPITVSSFIGRRREQTIVRKLLSSSRLLTLIGIGGGGKTRLAPEVARPEVASFPDGIWLVELAAISDATLLPEAIASAVGLTEIGPVKSLAAGIIDHLRPKHLLLILDNCEHLLNACAALTESLLAACPQLHILATSRESLAIRGETTYRVPSLSVPERGRAATPEQLGAYESVQLFVERARGHRPDFALTIRNALAVSQICARLDGIPLAIELAAARVSAMPVDGIAARLDDCFRLLTGGPRTALPRQRTLRAALDWSYDLLSPSERALLRRLAVFAGGWTLEAAELVCAGDSVGDWEVLDLLTNLVDKSLIGMDDRDGGARYWLQETMRQYAQEKLETSNEATTVLLRHVQWCLALAEEGAAALLGPTQQEWLERLATEHDNLRSALTWSQSVDAQSTIDPTTGLQLAGWLWRFWWMHGHLHEGRYWLEHMLANSDSMLPMLRARALDGAGVLAADQGDYSYAKMRHEESLAVWRALANQRGLAGALNNLASVAQLQGDYVQANTLHGESLAIWRGVRDDHGIANALNQLGCIARDAQGDYRRADNLLEESLELRRELGDTRGITISLNNLGLVAALQGEYARATSLLEESLRLRRSLRDSRGVAISLGNLGRVANRQGDFAKGKHLYQQSLTIRRDLGDKRGIAECLEGLAAVAALQQLPKQATTLLGTAEALRESIGLPHLPTRPTNLDIDITTLRAAIGEQEFARLWATGRALTLQEAIATAYELSNTGAEASTPA